MTDGDGGPRRPPGYLYVQAADELEVLIRAGEWSQGDRLPGRGKLAARLGVAEDTIRRALRVLAGRGMVRILPSSGAWVTWECTPGAHQHRLKGIATDRNVNK